ncbi:hypothetical protein ADK86_26185 [Streptomyces sp. NRRL F-5755]|uniref:hypothetical protein n=1 Tax=Streptomyces sp. NRRL F-5755 TaxID=1519475 RepID=UPI0006AE2C97|nr:hypothetical protein [Streptomyces sp. NRRL F-5755]KOT90395.1 hypothetical protein ADK86_26185 [Streptomyces sp. NRRL F-5755]
MTTTIIETQTTRELAASPATQRAAARQVRVYCPACGNVRQVYPVTYCGPPTTVRLNAGVRGSGQFGESEMHRVLPHPRQPDDRIRVTCPGGLARLPADQ